MQGFRPQQAKELGEYDQKKHMNRGDERNARTVVGTYGNMEKHKDGHIIDEHMDRHTDERTDGRTYL